MKRDLRDPVLLGDALLGLRQDHARVGRKQEPCAETAEAYAKALEAIPDYEEQALGPLEKYGRPQDLPEGKYVRWISS